jgi:hypothetical protein
MCSSRTRDHLAVDLDRFHFSYGCAVHAGGTACGARRRIAPTFGWRHGCSASRTDRRVCEDLLYEDQGIARIRSDAYSLRRMQRPLSCASFSWSEYWLGLFQHRPSPREMASDLGSLPRYSHLIKEFHIGCVASIARFDHLMRQSRHDDSAQAFPCRRRPGRSRFAVIRHGSVECDRVHQDDGADQMAINVVGPTRRRRLLLASASSHWTTGLRLCR